MKIVSWNIERGYHPNETVAFLKNLNADVYALYELDRGVKRTKGVDMFSLIEEGLKMPGKYVKEFDEIESVWRTVIPWGGPGGGEIGNALFTRLPIVEYHSIELPTTSTLRYDGSTWVPELFQPRRGSRKAQIATLETPFGIITCVAMHAELWRSNWAHRKTQLETAIHNIPPQSLILMGDFNNVTGTISASLSGKYDSTEVLSMREWLASKELVDPFSNMDVTGGRLVFKSKIDWLAMGNNFRVREKEMLHTLLSDHACLSVEIEPSSLA